MTDVSNNPFITKSASLLDTNLTAISAHSLISSLSTILIPLKSNPISFDISLILPSFPTNIGVIIFLSTASFIAIKTSLS